MSANAVLIATKFLLFLNAGDKSGQRLALVLLPQVPDVGEIVNIGDNPYRVVERSWAIDVHSYELEYGIHGEQKDLQCFVKVQKAGDFKVKIRDKEF
jgi:hypothetical protein